MNLYELEKRCPRNFNNKTEMFPEHHIPFNADCVQKIFDHFQKSLKKYEKSEELIYTTIYIIISIIAIIGNSFVILAVIRKKEMRTNRNIFVVNLALSNLMLAITTVPFLWIPSINIEFPYSKFFCKFANALPGSNIYCSTLTICVIAIERYYSIKKMDVISRSNHCIRAIIISFFIWVVSLLLSFPLLIYYDIIVLYLFKNIHVYYKQRDKTFIQSYGWRFCKLNTDSINILSDNNMNNTAQMIKIMMSVLQFLFIYVIPLFVLSVFNAKLTRFLKLNTKQTIRTKNDRLKKSTNGILHESYLSEPLNRRASINSIIKIIEEPSNKDRKNKNRSRTTILLVLMAASYAVLWLPFTIISIIIDFDIVQIEEAIIERIDQACKLISILSICVNPLLYGFLNTNFNREFVDLFKNCICIQNLYPKNKFT